MKCLCCGQDIQPRLSQSEFERRAIPRLDAIDRLKKRIDFHDDDWGNTPDGQRYLRLVRLQNADEIAAGH